MSHTARVLAKQLNRSPVPMTVTRPRSTSTERPVSGSRAM